SKALTCANARDSGSCAQLAPQITASRTQTRSPAPLADNGPRAVSPTPCRCPVKYARRYVRTIRLYDLPGPGDPAVLEPREAWRSRIIGSRLSHRQHDQLVERTRSAPWNVVPIRCRPW